MKTLGIRRIFIIAGVASLFVSYLGIWVRLINNPIERTGADFIAFYSAGRVAQQKGAAHVYDPILQQEVQEEEVGFPLIPGQVLLYNHLPFLIPILQSIVSADYVNSFYRWIFLLIVLYIAAITFPSQLLKDAGFNKSIILLTGVGGLLFLPLFFSLMNGQDTAFLFLGAAIWMYGLFSGKELLAGIGLSLTTVRPHIALILALPMLFRYYKVFMGFALGAGSLALFSILILGLEGTQKFMDILLLSAGGEWYGMKESAMYNLIGLLTRISPWLGTDLIRIIGWAVYGITIIAFCVLWARKRDIQIGQIGLTVTLALFAVPHLHFHDLTLLLIPIYEVIYFSNKGGQLKTSVTTILPIVISLLLLTSNASPFLQYTTPYLIMAMLVGYPYLLKHGLPTTKPRRS